MSRDGRPRFLHHWEGFLPPQSVVMGKRAPGEPSAPNLPANQEPDEARPLLSFVVPAELSSDQADTFHRMVSALGLHAHEHELLVGDASAARGHGVVLLNAPQGEWINERTLSTYTLQNLLESPAAKKAIWNDLKILLGRVRQTKAGQP